MEKSKRITFKYSRPNPLFQSWLTELYNEAVEKDSKLKDVLRAALESLSKYPLPLQTGGDCAILKGFGKKLCTFLDMRLEAYHSKSTKSIRSSPLKCSVTSPNIPASTNSNDATKQDEQEKSYQNEDNYVNKTNQSSRKLKLYKPKPKTGGYAILIALMNLHNEHRDIPITKELLIEKAQPFSEESFTRPKPESHYTAWSSMSVLISKGLVSKSRKRLAEFSLTNEGIKLAKELVDDSHLLTSVNDVIFNDVSQVNNVNKTPTKVLRQEIVIPNEQFIQFPAGSYDVILLIDKQETSGLSKKNDPTVAQFNKYPDLKHEYRHLKVGDFTWIARNKENKSLELVLPYIVERKRMDDLGSSIKDGRFHEQKFRLRKCGLNNVIYMVENYGSNKNVGLPYQSLMQALANTRIQDNFKVHVTDGLTNSARFLAMMTKRLTIEFQKKSLKGVNGDATAGTLMTFEYFNKSSAKTKVLSVKETFIKLLLQLKGMSVEKALAITSVYETPRSLIEAYKECDRKDGELLLCNLRYGDLNRNVGPMTSKAVYMLLSKNKN